MAKFTVGTETEGDLSLRLGSTASDCGPRSSPSPLSLTFFICKMGVRIMSVVSFQGHMRDYWDPCIGKVGGTESRSGRDLLERARSKLGLVLALPSPVAGQGPQL